MAAAASTAGDDAASAESALQAALDAKTAQLEALEAELEETNRGVVALYAELDTQAQQLRQATDLKSRFLSYMSHEFRTPIASIRSLTRLLLDRVDGPLTEEQERQVRFIASTSAEFAEMVDDLLDLAKVEAGRVEISPAWFELVDLFSALRGMFKPVLVNPEVSLVFEEPSGMLPLYTDDKKLSQILRNFISNALKFTPKGEVRVSVRQNGDASITFAVSDTGIGISDEKLAIIFEPFQQADGTTTRKYGGTGLGLSISREFAALLGGTIVVSSQPGEGTTFTLYMPDARVPDTMGTPQIPGLAPPAQVRAVPAVLDMPLITGHIEENGHNVTAASRQLDGATVLIVDDDVRNVFALTSALEMHGLNVLYADNGVDGVRLLVEHPDVDIVLMDAMMPDQDGYETTRGIRRNQRFRDLPVVFLTAKAMPGDRESALAAGASDYITKPVDLDELIELMARWVNADETEKQNDL